MRRFFDKIYLYSGGLAAIAILAICVLVTGQVCLNILARIGGPQLSFTIPSYADFAGYLLATASFLGLAHTLRHGTHIRVNLVISRLPERPRWALELLTLAIAAAVSGYAVWYAAALMLESQHYGDMSTGIVAIPIWIPQCAMVAGLALLTLAFVDTLIESLQARRAVILDQSTE
ncbi:TRAP transporter small permease [Thioclava sp. BHET1]|uniref:TRAP transporter small permease protein n=1 Tax=Thioclava dalianensis TaxID=1185766 RepID=A0A074TFS8_9RHOB|nr:TRAP transporter small permease [Thioclava dalianensis]KEP70524.1 C4-dicarboxylate ABC transporter permease [Thioclava dalianensis]TMV90673.1 TRAP transporter small permease [Thioclava sp. BHET1]SFN08271.1 TRAP-type mannitol/chloroaromatic compound transport system, small permease component [Thioclava dalianensis]